MKAGRRFGALFVLGLGLARGPAAEPLRLEAIGGPVPVPGVGNAELSGITWVGGNRYLAVDDGRARLLPLEVTLEPGGAIAHVAAGASVALAGARDSEGIAWWPAARSILVSDELGHEIREHDPTSGALLRRIPPPPPFPGRLRTDRGFEGIAVSPGGEQVWIANEGPLRLDGDAASAEAGAWLRLQRLDASFSPRGQFAYRSEAGLGIVGIVDLLVAGTGELLVLERALTGGGFSARIFAVDLARASDVTRVASLSDGQGFRPVRKRELWRHTGGFQNFEGAALGPELASGGRLVLLVSDGGGRRAPHLLALRLQSAPAVGD